LRPPLAAVGFLTVLPVARRMPDAAEVAGGAAAYPLVGAAVGALVGGVAVGLHHLMGATLAAALAVAAGAAVTGGLHLDALADAADAMGGRSRDEALRIMRDPGVGAFGVAALALDLLVKVAALASLLGGQAVLAMVAAGALSRATAGPLAAFLPYARAGGGTGAVLSGRVGRPGAAVAMVVAMVIAVAAARLEAGAAIAVAAAVTLLVGVEARRRLGGVTGDVLGAAIELCETLAVVAIAAHA
jgi:adenosylcobinamide-GDP ribazoletransferase